MKIGIMQPYFFPYIGYFQLINKVDAFVVYDNIEYTKKGWINRNRILVTEKDEYISIPLRKASDYLNVNERFLADNWKIEKIKILNKIKNSYFKTPYFNEVYPIIEKIIEYNDNNLFNFIYNSIQNILTYLEIKTTLVVSSSIEIDNDLKSEKKVIEICKQMNATEYYNPIGGINIYSKQYFKENNIDLFFIKSNEIEYKQFDYKFTPYLSIIDVMMFNNKHYISSFIQNEYKII